MSQYLNFRKALVASLIVVGSWSQAQLWSKVQLCNPDIPSTSPTDHFYLNDDGTALHLPTGLMWTRCAYNQVWTGDGCSPFTTNYFEYDWILQVADSSQFAGFDDWRVPNVKELSTIVERSCESPAINSEVFPGLRSGRTVWTSTYFVGPGQYDHWFVKFSNGNVTKYDRGVLLLVRDYE